MDGEFVVLFDLPLDEGQLVFDLALGVLLQLQLRVEELLAFDEVVLLELELELLVLVELVLVLGDLLVSPRGRAAPRGPCASRRPG